MKRGNMNKHNLLKIMFALICSVGIAPYNISNTNCINSIDKSNVNKKNSKKILNSTIEFIELPNNSNDNRQYAIQHDEYLSRTPHKYQTQKYYYGEGNLQYATVYTYYDSKNDRAYCFCIAEGSIEPSNARYWDQK